MKPARFLVGAALAALMIGAPAGLGPVPPGLVGEARAQSERDATLIEEFREKLAPLGAWVRMKSFGQIWQPAELAADWKPYTVGRWIFNDQVGWYFASDEPWAEITDPYSCWYEDD